MNAKTKHVARQPLVVPVAPKRKFLARKPSAAPVIATETARTLALRRRLGILGIGSTLKRWIPAMT